MTQIEPKEKTLFVVLGGFFLTNAILAEFIGVKIFSLEKTLGLSYANLRVFSVEGLSFNMTAGVLLWPFVFIVSDIINEYYGRRGVQLLSYLASGMVIYAFAIVYIAIHLSPADFWQFDPQSGINLDLAFRKIFGQGLWIIFGSLVAFLLGQLIDVSVFHYVRRKTGGKQIWLRATGSTLVSQFIDSFVVLFIAFIGGQLDARTSGAIAIINYIYKFCVAILLTPVLYFVHNVINRFLGERLAQAMVKRAAETSQISLYVRDDSL